LCSIPGKVAGTSSRQSSRDKLWLLWFFSLCKVRGTRLKTRASWGGGVFARGTLYSIVSYSRQNSRDKLCLLWFFFSIERPVARPASLREDARMLEYRILFFLCNPSSVRPCGKFSAFAKATF